MEGRFGRDFGGVKIHHDSRADVSARAVDAHAYTVGNHIVFRFGRFSPNSETGRRLLAHELTHVVQQGAAPASLQRKCACGGNAPQGGECEECKKKRLQRESATGAKLLLQRDDAPPERIDVAIVFGDEADAMTEAQSYAPIAIRVTSGEDAKKKLDALGKPIGKIYVVSHSTSAGQVQVISSIGIISWVNLSTLSADLKGLPADKAPVDVDFRGCKLGDAPGEMETFRKNIGAKSARGMTCWSIVNTVTPLVLPDGTPLTDKSQIPAGMEKAVDEALVKQIANLKSKDGHAVKDCIEGLAAGETAKANFAKVKNLYFAHKGNLAAVWASPEYNYTWQKDSKCVKDLTETTSPCKFVKTVAPPPAATGGTENKGAMLEPTGGAGDLVSAQDGDRMA